MGLFGLFGNKDNGQNNNINYESVTKPYSRNTYTSKVESVNSLELFKKYGLDGFFSYLMTLTHLKTLDELSLVFDNKSISSDVLKKMKIVCDKKNTNHRMVDYLKKTDLSEIFDFKDLITSNRQLSKSSYVHKYQDKFFNEIQNFDYNKFINHSEIVGEILGLEEEELSNFSREIIGGNNMFVFTVSTPIKLKSDSQQVYEEVISTSWFPNNSGNYTFHYPHRWVDRNTEEYWRFILTLYTEIHYLNYEKVFSTFFEQYFQNNDFRKNLMNFKKTSHDLSSLTDKYNEDLNLIIRHLEVELNSILEYVNFIKSPPEFDKKENEIIVYRRGMGGFGNTNEWDFPEDKVIYEYLFNRIFSLEYVLFVGVSMLSYVENGDDFSYQELKLQIEPLGIFDKTIDKLILKK